ncbi:MAG: sensor histidine kinase [Pseudolysinimonas sp.]
MTVRRPGIRARIAGGSFAIAALISVVAGILINAQVERIVREGTEAILRSDGAPYTIAIVNEPGDTFDVPGPAQLVAVINPTGVSDLDTLPAGVLARIDLESDAGATQEVDVAAGRYLVRVESVDGQGGEWFVVSARRADEQDTVLGQMRTLLIGGLTVITLGVTLASWLLTSASLGPVRRIRRTAQRIMRSPSAELLPVGPSDDEIARLAVTLNELITDLRAAAERERQLVSDASHELRTPLAILRTRLELARSNPGSVDSLIADVESAERSAQRLTRLVESLLQLSQIEAGSTDGRSTGEELAEEVRDAAGRAEFRATGEQVEVTIDLDVADTTRYPIRAEDFGRIVDNLTGNALRATGGSGILRIVFAADRASAALVIIDTGGGMDADFVTRARDRFSRADAARTSGDGVGLGLAIVAAIVERADGSLHLDNRPGDGLTVRIELPAVD